MTTISLSHVTRNKHQWSINHTNSTVECTVCRSENSSARDAHGQR